MVEGWSSNPTLRLVKSSKLYFNDTGLLCALLGFRSVEALLSSTLFGSVWETWCLCQIRTWLSNRGRLHGNLFYWRTKDGKEVDFIFEEDQKIYALECKSKELPDTNDIKSLRLLKLSMPQREVHSTILCKTPTFVSLVKDLDVALDNACHLDRAFGE